MEEGERETRGRGRERERKGGRGEEGRGEGKRREGEEKTISTKCAHSYHISRLFYWHLFLSARQKVTHCAKSK